MAKQLRHPSFRLDLSERLEADASRSRESLTPPSLNPAYKIEINHDKDDSGDFYLQLFNFWELDESSDDCEIEMENL